VISPRPRRDEIGAEVLSRSGAIAWTLHDNKLGVLRSEETIEEAFAAIADLPVCGHLAARWLPLGANVLGGCCGTSPEYIAHLKALRVG
jgi:S-methylmethionine-dependent homocysteine/selenocysteine methylase